LVLGYSKSWKEPGVTNSLGVCSLHGHPVLLEIFSGLWVVFPQSIQLSSTKAFSRESSQSWEKSLKGSATSVAFFMCCKVDDTEDEDFTQVVTKRHYNPTLNYC